MRSCLFLLLALSAAAFVSARPGFQQDGARSLLQTAPANAFCPEGCDRDNGGCVQDATMAGLRCQKCLGTLFVNKVNGNCSCPAGKFGSTVDTCTDCQKGYYCPGGDYSYDGITYYPQAFGCPVNMTTVGKRSVSNRGCVQLPGFYYTISADGLTVGAVQCPVDTYSPGLKKQRACVPCPTGFTTNGVTGATSPTQCLVPAGYYLKAPGQVAPCPKGEYKELFGPSANCTKCAFGVTTIAEGSISVDNCTILMPGYYAQAMNGAIVTRTVICPQGYYCPGGSPAANTPFVPPSGTPDNTTIIKCAGDAWTIDVGAQAAEQCLVPPGFFYDTIGATTSQCEAGSFRADWKPTSQATECTACGAGVRAAKTDQIKVYNILNALNTSMLSVTSSADDCYIMPGQGLYYSSTTFAWRARNCSSNNYGVNNITYGLTPAPCRDCPTNMVAVNDAVNYPNSTSFFTSGSDSFGAWSGFISVKACVTQDGYGYDGRIAQQCAVGTYNKKDTYGLCTKCDYGLTTNGVGVGVTVADCGMAGGFGVSGGAIRECPIGTYNDQAWQGSKTVACSDCPTGTTTQGTGSNDAAQCNLCVPGYGGANCSDTCGGDSGALAGTYGPPGRSTLQDPACLNCSTQTTGYSFEWNLGNDIYAVSAISPQNASSSTECLSQFAQVFDGAWYLPVTTSATNATGSIATFADCVALCTSPSCQYLTYDYKTQTCYIRAAATQIYVGAPVIGYKAVPAGDVGTSAWDIRHKKGKVAGKAVASGQYTFYQDPNALEVGNWTDAQGRQGQAQPADRMSYTKWQQCLNACDDDVACTAFIIELYVNVALRPTSCRLIYGRTDVGEFKRSMTRADIARLKDISGNLK